MPRAKTRTRIVYRDKPAKHWLSLETVKRIKEWFYVMAPVAVAIYVVAGPYVDSKAAEYLKVQLAQMGMDPETVQALNKNLVELQAQVEEKDNTVKKLSEEVIGIKGDIDKMLFILEKGLPAVAAEPVK